MVRNLEILGEAAKNIPDRVRDMYGDVPWREMAGMRDKLIHGYFGVNINVVWETVGRRLHGVKTEVKAVLDEMDEEQGDI